MRKKKISVISFVCLQLNRNKKCRLAAIFRSVGTPLTKQKIKNPTVFTQLVDSSEWFRAYENCEIIIFDEQKKGVLKWLSILSIYFYMSVPA